MEYQEEHQIEYNECDENGRLKMPTMIDLLMQVSEHQLEKGGAGTPDLLKRGLGWVVTQYHFDFSSVPHSGQKVNLSTRASGYNRFFEYRDFTIRDDQGGAMVKVRSQWVLFDLQKRRLVPTDTKLMQAFAVPLLKKMPHFPRLRALSSYDRQRQYRVRFDDLDSNHHLTNSHYFNWFLDMLSRDFLKGHLPTKIDISFEKEIKYGEEPFSCLTLKKEPLVSYHALIGQDKREKAVCVIHWRKI